MSISTPFAYNSGSTITGMTQFGSVAVGSRQIDYTTNPGDVIWWQGPDESEGYVIACPMPNGNQSTPLGDIGTVGFWRSNGFTDASFLATANEVAGVKSQESFNSVTGATEWLSSSGFPTTYISQHIYEPDSITYFSGLTTTLSLRQMLLVNKFVVDMKTGFNINSLSEIVDAMYILGGETAESSLRNLSKRAHDATAVNAPIFTPYEGFKFNGTSQWINCNYNTINHSVTAVQTGTTRAVYVRTDNYSGNRQAITGYENSDPRTEWFTYNDTVWLIRLNTGVPNYIQPAYAYSSKHDKGMLINRYYDGRISYYRNKSVIVNQISSTAGFANVDYYIGMDLAVVARFFNENQFAFFMLGRGFSQSECNILTDAFEEYMWAHNKNII